VTSAYFKFVLHIIIMVEGCNRET